jgi:predicted nucleic acid-binding protein
VSKRRLVDTNLIVRYLVQDHEKHAKAAGRLFDACDRGDMVIVVLPAVLAECLFVLESFYQHPRGDIALALGRLISSPGVEISGVAIHLDALDRYRKTKFHFVDCLLAATAAAEDISVATFDQDFRKFGDVRIESQ